MQIKFINHSHHSLLSKAIKCLILLHWLEIVCIYYDDGCLPEIVFGVDFDSLHLNGHISSIDPSIRIFIRAGNLRVGPQKCNM